MLQEVIEKLERFGRDNASAIAKANAGRKKLPTNGEDEEEREKKRKDKARLIGAKTPEQRRQDAQDVLDADMRRAARAAVSKRAALDEFEKSHPVEFRTLIESDYIRDDDAPDEQERAVTKSLRRTELDPDEIADSVEKMASNLRAQDLKLSKEGAVVKVLELFPHLYDEYVYSKS